MSGGVVVESSGGHIGHPVVDAGYMSRACVRRPAMGDQDALSLFVQLTVGVLSHQVATWMCQRVARCSNMR